MCFRHKCLTFRLTLYSKAGKLTKNVLVKSMAVVSLIMYYYAGLPRMKLTLFWSLLKYKRQTMDLEINYRIVTKQIHEHEWTTSIDGKLANFRQTARNYLCVVLSDIGPLFLIGWYVGLKLAGLPASFFLYSSEYSENAHGPECLVGKGLWGHLWRLKHK